MVVDDLIHVDDKPSVLRSLLLRHRHVNEHQSGFPFTKRKYNSYTSLQVIYNFNYILINHNTSIVIPMPLFTADNAFPLFILQVLSQ